MKKAAIIGFGCAGYHAALAMREHGYDGEIHVFSSTDAPPSNPMLTTYYVSDRIPQDGLYPFGDIDFIQQKLALTLHRKTRVAALDSSKRCMTLENGEHMEFDSVLISTGANPFVPPLEGADHPRIFCMRTEEDAHALRQELEKGTARRAVVIGASMVGIKIAELMLRRGISCSMVDLAPHLFPAAALPDVASILEDDLNRRGIKCHFSVQLQGFTNLPDGSVRCHFADGGIVDGDIVALCIGTRCETSLADAGVKVDRAILVDDRMRTTAPGIYSAGDCCAALNLMTGTQQSIGLWQNAAQQGKVAGANMVGGEERFTGSVPHNITHYFDVDFIGIGDCRSQGERLIYHNEEKRILIHIILQGKKISCINILSDYKISGVFKHYFLRQFSDGISMPFSSMARARLLNEGVPPAFIEHLEECTISNQPLEMR